MINQEIQTKMCNSHRNSECLPHGQSELDLSRNSLVFSEHDFMDWCSKMTIEDLQQCFVIYFPQAATYFRKNWTDNGKNWTFQISQLQGLSASLKNYAINTYKKFTQALLLVSNKDYLDSITFNADCFLFPNKVYKLLASAKLISDFLNYIPANNNSEHNSTVPIVKYVEIDSSIFKNFQLLSQLAGKIQKNIETKMKLQNKFKMKNQAQQFTKTIIHQFNGYWRYCSEQVKNGIWYLGYHEVRKAVVKCLSSQKSYKFDLTEIQQYVRLAQKIGAKQLKDKIFSWKLNRNDNGITDYMELVFGELKHRMVKKYKESSKSKSRKPRKRRSRPMRRPSLSVSQASNETNQTDIIYQYEELDQFQFNVNINELIETKIQKNIVQLADDANQQANEYYDNRVQAFQRLKNILAALGINIKLYGSCCCGLAIRNSDVDVTVPEIDLQPSFGYLSDSISRVSAFFQYLQYYFTNFPWISHLNIIKSATIPIIKFTIDTSISYNTDQTYTPSIATYTQGPVQFDLTVETTEPGRVHLGILSTKQTQQWLTEITTLQNIAIIIKKQLAKRSLNQTYYGGLNTYTLLIMIVAFIRKEKLSKQEKVGLVLQRVLKFYSESFDQEKLGIDLNCSQIFYHKQQSPLQNQDLSNPRKLQIKDPQGDHKIITRNCYQFKAVKKLLSDIHTEHFVKTRQKIEQLCSLWNPKENSFNQNQLLEWVEKRMDRNWGSQQCMKMVRLQ